MITVDVQDYVIVQENNKRNLIKITGAKKDGKTFYGVHERKRIHDNPEEIEIQIEDIVANLGKEPVYGSVYGCSTEIYRNKKKLDGWGHVYFYRKMEKEELKELRNSMAAVHKEMQELGLELHPFDTEIRESRGKWAGFYKYRPKKVDGVSTDLICLKPKTFDNLKPLLYHELGHSVWYRRLTPDVQARWILNYHKALELQTVSKKEIDDLVGDFVESRLMCKEFKNTLGERQEMIFEQCLDFVDGTHLLNSHHLDTLIASEHDISGYFNIDDVKLTDMRLILTEYAQVSPEEFFAEAFSLHMSGSILPKSLRELMEKTIKKAKNYVEQDDE